MTNRSIWSKPRCAALDGARGNWRPSNGSACASFPRMTSPHANGASPSPPIQQTSVHAFPKGPFRFFALDVETANNDRGSICQIGVACVRPDNSIETWVTYVDPQVDRWVFTYLHGISARTVQGAPTFAEVLPILQDALKGTTIYQHSGFDRSAIAAACGNCGLPDPAVGLARQRSGCPRRLA
jgi:DNA polymerase III subunit epsilon